MIASQSSISVSAWPPRANPLPAPVPNLPLPLPMRSTRDPFAVSVHGHVPMTVTFPQLSEVVRELGP